MKIPLGKADDAIRAIKGLASKILRRSDDAVRTTAAKSATRKPAAQTIKTARTPRPVSPARLKTVQKNIDTYKPPRRPVTSRITQSRPVQLVRRYPKLAAGIGLTTAGGLAYLSTRPQAKLPPINVIPGTMTYPGLPTGTKTQEQMVEDLYKTGPYADLLGTGGGGGAGGTGLTNEEIITGMYNDPAFSAPIATGPSLASLLEEAYANPAFSRQPSAVNYLGAVEQQNQQTKANLEAYLKGIRGYGANTAKAMADAYLKFSKGTAELGQKEFLDAQEVAANIDQLYRELGLAQAETAVAPVGEATMVTGLTPASGEMATAQQTTPAYGAGIADYMGREGILSREALGQLALSQAEQGAGLSQNLLNQIELAASMQQAKEAQAAAARLAEARIRQAEFNADYENRLIQQQQDMLMQMFGAKSQDAAIARDMATQAREDARARLAAITQGKISDRDYLRSLDDRNFNALLEREDRLFQARLNDAELGRGAEEERKAAVSKAAANYDFNPQLRVKIDEAFPGGRQAWLAYVAQNPATVDLIIGRLGGS